MGINQKQCMVCKAMFIPCTSCDKLKVFYKDEIYQWKKVVCCSEHFFYHLPIIEYKRGMITKEEAKEQLQNAIDKYGNLDFNDNVKFIVEDILAEEITEFKEEVSKKELNPVKKSKKKV